MSKFSNGHGNVSKMKDVLYLKTEKFESEIGYLIWLNLFFFGLKAGVKSYISLKNW